VLGARLAEDALAHSKRDFASFASFQLICSRQDQPGDAILEDRLVKVDEQSHRHVQDLHVTEELQQKITKKTKTFRNIHWPTRNSQALVTFVSFCLIDDPTVATSRFAVFLNPTYLERMSINYLGRGISKSHARIVERIRWGMRSSQSENHDSIIAEAGY
jgi:hypothetical protein